LKRQTGELTGLLKAKEEEIERHIDQILRFGKIIDHFHKITHIYRDTVLNILTSEQEEEINRSFNWFFNQLLNIYREIFVLLTGTNDICTSFKLFVGDKDVITFCRDSLSFSARDDLDRRKTYNIDKNTDFQQLFYIQRACFIENDLEALDGYINERQNWSDYYKSTVVAPVRRQVDDNRFHFAGFLCVDSLKKDVFEPDPSKAISLGLADVLYPMILVYKHRLGDFCDEGG